MLCVWSCAGRIGRLVARVIAAREDIELVAVYVRSAVNWIEKLKRRLRTTVINFG